MGGGGKGGGSKRDFVGFGIGDFYKVRRKRKLRIGEDNRVKVKIERAEEDDKNQTVCWHFATVNYNVRLFGPKRYGNGEDKMFLGLEIYFSFQEVQAADISSPVRPV